MARQLRKEIPKGGFFPANRRSGLVRMDDAIPPKVIAWLYEFSLGMRLEKATVEIARRTLLTTSWRNSENKTAKFLSMLDDYPRFDPERAWRRAVGSRKDSRTRRRASQLEQDIRGLNHQIHWWKRYASSDSWQERYRGHVVVMDRYLAKRLPTILNEKTQRAAVISAVLEAMALKKAESTDAILRMLRRQVVERKRSRPPGP